MTLYRWYTGMERHLGARPPWYLRRAVLTINSDAALYVLAPFHLLPRWILRMMVFA